MKAYLNWVLAIPLAGTARAGAAFAYEDQKTKFFSSGVRQDDASVQNRSVAPVLVARLFRCSVDRVFMHVLGMPSDAHRRESAK